MARRRVTLARGGVGGLDVHLAEHFANGGDQVPHVRRENVKQAAPLTSPE